MPVTYVRPVVRMPSQLEMDAVALRNIANNAVEVYCRLLSIPASLVGDCGYCKCYWWLLDVSARF